MVIFNRASRGYPKACLLLFLLHIDFLIVSCGLIGGGCAYPCLATQNVGMGVVFPADPRLPRLSWGGGLGWECSLTFCMPSTPDTGLLSSWTISDPVLLPAPFLFCLKFPGEEKIMRMQGGPGREPVDNCSSGAKTGIPTCTSKGPPLQTCFLAASCSTQASSRAHKQQCHLPQECASQGEFLAGG